MKVSFIIPLYNCLPLTQAMLASLQSTLPAGLAHEIIFVDDGSTDGTRPWLATLPPPCRAVLNEKNLGFAGACNRGAATATGEFLFFLNNDLVLRPRWLEPMLAAFVGQPDAGLVGNVQRSVATGAVDHTGIYFNHKGKPAHDTALPWTARWLGWPAVRAADAITGACFGLRAALWRQLGGFDEGYRNGSEDIDLCLRAREAGYRTYVALRSVVGHHISASLGRKLRDEENTFRLVSRWRGRIASLAALDWSREFIRTHWELSCLYDDRLGRVAFYYALGLLPSPPAAVLAGTDAAIQFECDRWTRLLRPAGGEA
jgi:GT2 family glycosyltransferase